MDSKILEDLGFSNAEIRVYLALLELGSSTAGNIIEKSGLQSSVVFLTLKKLVEKGLASFVLEGQRKHYQAANPKHIVEFIEAKKRDFERIIPELIHKQKAAKEKPEVVVFRGVRGVKEVLLQILNAGGTEHNTFGSSKKSLMLGDAWWVDYHRQRAKKNIKARLLFNESLQFWKAEKKYPKSEVRYTSAGFEPLTETIIRNDKIAIIIWTDKPIATLIHNSVAATSYNDFFELLWKKAKK